MNKTWEHLESDRYAIHCPESEHASGPWTLFETAKILGEAVAAGRECAGKHRVELIEVTN